MRTVHSLKHINWVMCKSRIDANLSNQTDHYYNRNNYKNKMEKFLNTSNFFDCKKQILANRCIKTEMSQFRNSENRISFTRNIPNASRLSKQNETMKSTNIGNLRTNKSATVYCSLSKMPSNTRYRPINRQCLKKIHLNSYYKEEIPIEKNFSRIFTPQFKLKSKPDFNGFKAKKLKMTNKNPSKSKKQKEFEPVSIFGTRLL